MKKIFFVTSNENKLREVQEILGRKLDNIDLDIDEIQTLEVREVVKEKAWKAYQQVKKPILVEDTGVYIDSWKGFPGALIKWLLKTLGNGGICNALVSRERDAFVETCFCLYDGKKFRIFVGRVDGRITETPRGETNFGWDPIFQPRGYEKTFAEMSNQEKNQLSMRKVASIKLKKFLEENGL
jgi:non-canonical purine NTP pyrophosphatase (RdgB/HAM1 family)